MWKKITHFTHRNFKIKNIKRERIFPHLVKYKINLLFRMFVHINNIKIIFYLSHLPLDKPISCSMIKNLYSLLFLPILDLKFYNFEDGLRT